MLRKKSMIFILAAVLMLSFALSGCSNSSSPSSKSGSDDDTIVIGGTFTVSGPVSHAGLMALEGAEAECGGMTQLSSLYILMTGHLQFQSLKAANKAGSIENDSLIQAMESNTFELAGYNYTMNSSGGNAADFNWGVAQYQPADINNASPTDRDWVVVWPEKYKEKDPVYPFPGW